MNVPVRGYWANVNLLRSSVQNCFNAVFVNVDGCNALSMVTGELLENAIKYGDWNDDAEQVFRLRVVGKPDGATVSVENPVKASDAGVKRLLDTLKWIDEFESPADAYRARLVQIAESAREQRRESRLGLVRVAYEGNCTLEAAVSEDRLTVTAELAL